MARDTAQAAVALGGGHGLVRHPERPAAPRRRPHHRRAHRDRDRRRQRRLVRSAPRRVRRAAARRPADGAGRPVRRRRVGPHLGRGRPAPLRRARATCSGHVIGNLLIVGLWELMGDHVPGPRLGRPAARRPGPGAADGDHADGHHRRGARARRRRTATAPPTVRGQVEVATTEGDIVSVALDPPTPEACTESVEAILRADWVFLGPGSWFTSVIPHLMVPGLRRGAGRAPRPGWSSCSTSSRRRGRPPASGRRTTSPRSSSTLPTSRSTRCSRTGGSVAHPDELRRLVTSVRRRAGAGRRGGRRRRPTGTTTHARGSLRAIARASEPHRVWRRSRAEGRLTGMAGSPPWR